ncbi:hypothetical protein, conserved [Babesia ovata]|uniref:Uncharacterized protein n=1 Tax=Babesia ovata TaxID=189622 RepID=A0A2H6KKH0_9APIC|nr:uncharacterized protein BOVATA_049700 [Babesia ovata]GBE63477.1 hypothetical protein, conserved [Babesia ovata]
MSFLHGVLGTVKNDESVKKYDGYIKLSNINDGLDNVLSTLRSKIGAGRDGLSESVTKVKEWLGNYNDEVEKKTKAVTQGLSALIGVDNEYYKSVEGKASKPLQEQLEGWKNIIPRIFDEVVTIETKHINMLDSKLHDKLMHETKPIKEAIKMLSKSAEQKKFVDQIRLVDETLEKQEKDVKNRIDEESKELKLKLVNQRDRLLAEIKEEFPKVEKMLEHEFHKIGKIVKSLEKIEKEQFKDIKEALKAVNNFMDTDFYRNHTYVIKGFIYDIKTALCDVDRENEKAGADRGKSKLHQDVLALQQQVNQIGEQLKGKDEELTAWNAAGAEAVKLAKQKCDEIVKKLDGQRHGNDDNGERARCLYSLESRCFC